MRPHLSPEYALTGIIFTIMLALSYIPKTLDLDPQYSSLTILALLALAYGHILEVHSIGLRQGLLRQRLHYGAIEEREFRKLYIRERDRSWVLKGTAMLAAGLSLGMDGGEGLVDESRGEGVEVGEEIRDDEVEVVEEGGAE